MLLTQPYSPHLFRQGVLPGPHLLHETLMRHMSVEECKEHWRKHEKEKKDREAAAKKSSDKETQPFLATVEACCRGCSDEATAEHRNAQHQRV